MTADLRGRRIRCGVAAATGSVAAALASGTAIAFVSGLAAFVAGWLIMWFLIRIGRARPSPEASPAPWGNRAYVAALLGASAWVLVAAVADKLSPGSGKDIVGSGLLGLLAGLILSLGFSSLAGERVQ